MFAPHGLLNEGAVFIEASILDRSKLTEIFRGCDCVVHIAAWHGIHEDRGEKDTYDFFDLNVRGTFEVFEAALGLDAAYPIHHAVKTANHNT
jgi:nucleoside-diphosphate-sugar epimerase